MIDPDTRIRIARWGIPASFGILFAISAVCAELWGPGFLRHGIAMVFFAVPAFFLAFPTAVALLVFAVVRSPVTVVLTGLSALIGFGWSVLGAWEIFSSHSSTAAIGLIFLPGLQLFLFCGIVIAGMALDGLVSVMRRKTAK